MAHARGVVYGKRGTVFKIAKVAFAVSDEIIDLKS
jgi:hypothetical protein